MATLLFISTWENALARFLLAEGVPQAEISHRVSAKYGNRLCWMCEWLTIFKNGCASVTIEERAGQPFTSCTDESIQLVSALILNYLQRLLMKWPNICQLCMVLPMLCQTRYRRIKIIKQYTSNTSIYYTSWLHVSTPMGSSSGLLIESCY